MDDLKKWVKEQCLEYLHIKWTAEHTDLYLASEAGQEILKDMAHYGRNAYTYPQEALSAYERLTGHLQRNPYRYMAAFGNAGEDDICASSVDGYLVEVHGEILPVGFLKTGSEKYGSEIERIIKKALEGYLDEFEREEKPFIQSLERGSDQQNELSLGGNKAEGKSVGVYIGLILEILFGICIAYFVFMGLEKEISMSLIAAGVVVGVAVEISSLAKTIKGISALKQNKAVSKQQQGIAQYYNEYMEVKNRYFTVEGIYGSTVPGSIFPLRQKEEYQSVLQNVQGIGASSGTPALAKKTFSRNVLLAFLCIVYSCLSVLTTADSGSSAAYSAAAETEGQALPDEEDAAGAEPEEEGQEQEGQEQESEEDGQQGQSALFDENGFLFADSDMRYLSEEELYQLQYAEDYDFKTLLGFARNEIYARLGYAFREDGSYYPYYMQYDWYRDMPHTSVDDSDLNQYEFANRELILRIEQEEGFRD